MNVHEGFAKSCGCSAIHEPPASLFGLQTVSRNYRACPQWEPYQLYEIICKSQILRRTMVKCGGWPPDFFREYGRFFFHVCFKLNEQSLKSLFWFVKFNHAEVTVRIRIRTCWLHVESAGELASKGRVGLIIDICSSVQHQHHLDRHFLCTQLC